VNLGDYARLLVRRGWILILLAVVAAGGAYYLSTQQAPVYRATQVVILQPSRVDLGLTEASRGVLEQHTAIINSSFYAEEVITRLNLDMLPQALMGNSTIVPNRNNLTIRIEVDSYAPEVAADIARTWGNLLVEYRNEENQEARREDRMDAIIQDEPQVALVRPRPEVNALAGGVIGLLLGAGIALMLEYIESTRVRSSDEVEQRLGLNVLAVIPDQGR